MKSLMFVIALLFSSALAAKERSFPTAAALQHFNAARHNASSSGVLSAGCPECDDFIPRLGSLGVEYVSPVCGVDGVTYTDECEALMCAGSLAVCAGECPCPKTEDPLSDWCSDMPYPNLGHFSGPGGFAELQVQWPEECCELCDADPACLSYTWLGAAAVAGSGGLFPHPTCFLYSSPSYPIPHPGCFTGDKIAAAPPALIGPDYYIGASLPMYWSDLLTGAGLPSARIGYNTTQGEWYCDDHPTCVGYGPYGVVCDDTQLVCAGGNDYGYGVDQIGLLLELLSMGDTRHYMCPSCPPFVPGEIEMCDGGVLQAYPDAGSVPPGLDTPGAMSTVEPSMWVECDCTMHHQGVPFAPGSYWDNQLDTAGIDATQVTYFGVQLYYDGKPTCAAFGASGDACDNGQYICAGGATYGAAVDQMTELATAIANAPSHMHPSC